MAGNAKFELSSVSPDDSGYSGSYSNGQRSNYAGPNLDRSGSFREGSDGRNLGSGPSTSKMNASPMTDLPPLTQCLVLEPIMMGELKSVRQADLKKAFALYFSNVSEDNSFGAAHSKPPPLATEEIKRFRAGVLEGSLKARNRMKRLDDSFNKLSKYFELSSKKQATGERFGGVNLLKMGTQSHRSSPDLATQKLEDRNKNAVLNKRARTPMGDLRGEGRSNGVPRQHLVLGKDKDGAKEGSSDLGDEKIRRLPAGGEGWDKKMKRKRSVPMSNVISRPVDGDGELKRNMHGRMSNDSGIHSSDAHSFRSGSTNGATSSNKVEAGPSPQNLSARLIPKNELDKTSVSRELTGMNKERSLQKGNSKLNMREDPHVFSPSSITKGKSSRTHRTGPASIGNSSPSFSRISGTAEDWEQPLNVNKLHSLAGVSNRKRPLPTDSSSSPMQWGGQRPQKISRNRRTNIVSPTSHHDEVQVSSEGCTSSDFSTRGSGTVNGSFPVRNIMSSSQQLKAKLDNAASPARLSESEENSAADNRLKDKELGGSELDDKSLNSHQHVSPGGFTKKSKLLVKDEIGDGVRRQGRSGRGSSLPKGSISPLREKLEHPAMVKPVRNTRPGSEKNGSKSGRPPLKKHSDRKGFTRLGPLPHSSSPDFTGESDDDREELLAAAQFACNASYNGCSSSFWKRSEPLFNIRPEDKSFLEEQLKGVDDHSNQTEMPSLGENILNHVSQNEHPRTQSSGESKICIVDNGLTESATTGEFINHFQDNDSSYRELDTEKGPNSLTPLYQRVLSALIVEDEFEEFEENRFLSNAASVANRDDTPCMEARISCNGNASHSRFSNIQVPMHEEIEECDYGLKYPVGQAGPGYYQNDTNGSIAIHMNSSGNASFGFEYDQMCMDEKLVLELQSIGLYPETVPDLAEGEDELINQDIVQLKKQLFQQGSKTKTYLEKMRKAVEEKEFEGRELEQLAMNRLIELAYRKLLATRGSSAARIGISKVPRHVALAFIRRTLARCRKFEDAGKSCFSEPALRDVLLAVPNSNIGAASGIQVEQNIRLDSRVPGAYLAVPEQLDLQNDKSDRGRFDAYAALAHQSDHAFAKNGPIVNRGKKKEVLLDDVGGNAALRSAATLGSSLLGGAKGKRSDRDSGAKAGRPSISNLKGERKTKSKPKQKAAQLSTHPVQPSANVSSELVANNSNRKREGLISPGNILDSSKECKDMDLGSLPLSELDSIEDLSVANEFEGHQDLSSWLNFDEEGLQDHDSMGLEIPMDDLSELNMLI